MELSWIGKRATCTEDLAVVLGRVVPVGIWRGYILDSLMAQAEGDQRPNSSGFRTE